MGGGVVADIGSLGLGSDSMFDIVPTVRVGITESAHLAVGYWWIALDHESDEDDDQRRLLYDVVSSGPFAGFVFRF